MTILTTQGRPYPIPSDDVSFAEEVLGIVFPSYLSRLYAEKGGLSFLIVRSQLLSITSLYCLAHQYSNICEVFGCTARELKRLGLTPFATSEGYGDLFLSARDGGGKVLGNVAINGDEVSSEVEWTTVEECVENHFDSVLSAKAEGANVAIRLFTDIQFEGIEQRHRPAYRTRLSELFRA